MLYKKVGMFNEIIETIIKIDSSLLKFDLLNFVRK